MSRRVHVAVDHDESHHWTDDLGLARRTGRCPLKALAGSHWNDEAIARLQPGGTFGIIVLLAVVVAAIFAPYLKTIGDGERDVRRMAQGKQLDGYLQPPNSDRHEQRGAGHVVARDHGTTDPHHRRLGIAMPGSRWPYRWGS